MNDGKICCEYLLYYIKLLNCDILLCKNVVIRNWFGKYLCVNEKMFLKILYYYGDICFWNVILVFLKLRELV